MRQCLACGFDRCDDNAKTCRQCGSVLPEPEADFSNKALAAAWWHYLEIPSVGVLELVPGKAFVMGRDPRSDLVLKTSKQPEVAKIFWTDGNAEATLEPSAGASSGVKIDGMLVPKVRRLKGGEEIEIGRLVLRYFKKSEALEGAISARRVRRRSEPDPSRGVATGPKPRGRARSNTALEPGQKSLRDLRQKVAPSRGSSGARDPSQRGSVGSSSGGQRPADIAKALEKTKAFGTLNVSAGAGRGWITVRAGKPQYASFAGRSGAAALEAILRLGPCRVNLVNGNPTRKSGSRIEVTFSQVIDRLKGRALGARPPRRPASARRARPGRRRRR